MNEGDFLYKLLLYTEYYIAFICSCTFVLCVIGFVKLNNVKEAVETLRGTKLVISHNTTAIEKLEKTLDTLTKRIIEDNTFIKSKLDKK